MHGRECESRIKLYQCTANVIKLYLCGDYCYPMLPTM